MESTCLSSAIMIFQTPCCEWVGSFAMNTDSCHGTGVCGFDSLHCRLLASWKLGFYRKWHYESSRFSLQILRSGLNTTFFTDGISNAFYWKWVFVFRSKFTWSFRLRMQLTKRQHSFKWWLIGRQTITRPNDDPIRRRICALLGLSELMHHATLWESLIDVLWIPPHYWWSVQISTSQADSPFRDSVMCMLMLCMIFGTNRRTVDRCN